MQQVGYGFIKRKAWQYKAKDLSNLIEKEHWVSQYKTWKRI